MVKDGFFFANGSGFSVWRFFPICNFKQINHLQEQHKKKRKICFTFSFCFDILCGMSWEIKGRTKKGAVVSGVEIRGQRAPQVGGVVTAGRDWRRLGLASPKQKLTVVDVTVISPTVKPELEPRHEVARHPVQDATTECVCAGIRPDEGLHPLWMLPAVNCLAHRSGDFSVKTALLGHLMSRDDVSVSKRWDADCVRTVSCGEKAQGCWTIVLHHPEVGEVSVHTKYVLQDDLPHLQAASTPWDGVRREEDALKCLTCESARKKYS